MLLGAQKALITNREGDAMSRYLALRDRRLEGGVPARDRLYIINTDSTTPLGRVFSEINATVRYHGSFDTMFIFCHGYAGSNPGLRVSMDAGGQGLQLGAESVMHRNVSMWRAIKNKVQNIVIYACAAANTERENVGTTADGRYLMGALAIHTGAHIYGGDRIQWYSRHGGLTNGRFEFRTWEGRLWHFPPSGGSAGIVSAPPVEFSDVMHSSMP
jgi:hypothetical protein